MSKSGTIIPITGNDLQIAENDLQIPENNLPISRKDLPISGNDLPIAWNDLGYMREGLEGSFAAFGLCYGRRELQMCLTVKGWYNWN